MASDQILFIALGLLLGSTFVMIALVTSARAHNRDRKKTVHAGVALQKEDDPFALSLEEFETLPEARKDSLRKTASLLNWPYATKYFEEHAEAKWIAIVKNQGNIVFSETDNEFPGSEEATIRDLQVKFGTPIFVYYRPTSIDMEIGPH